MLVRQSQLQCAVYTHTRAICSVRRGVGQQIGPSSHEPRNWGSGAAQQQQRQQHLQWSCNMQRTVRCRDSNSSGQDTQSSSSGSSETAAGSSTGLAVNAALLALWAALMGYVFFLAPNQTPTIDSFIVEKLVGLKSDDPYEVNQVFFAVWNCMALYPLIYAALLIPGARTNKLPAWPFVCTSVFLGAYALIPYMALWAPKNPPGQLPPPESELQGWNKFFMRAAETPWLPLGLLAGSSYWVYTAVTAGLNQWLGYVQLFDESRLVHATSLDFMLCTLFMYFCMGNDAQGRKWDKRDALVPLLCLLPLVGPSIYLSLRPKTYDSKADSN